MSASSGNMDLKNDIKIEEAHISEHTSAPGCNAEEGSCMICKDEHDRGGTVKREVDLEEPSFFDLVNSFSADIDAFAEAVDDLENISENVHCLIRNTIQTDGRPVGAWKDLC